jgi:uncharacterized protein YjbI with pentapeptide repeats
MSATINIKHRRTGAVLFSHKVSDERHASGLAMRDALEAACKARANLAGAYLAGAYLAYVNLAGAYLADANLADANLSGANLAGANLEGVNLEGANLAGANLADANLSGAKWSDGIILQRAPLYVYGLRWTVVILDKHMQIGCELHSLAEWRGFDDARIVAMDGRDAMRFWRAHKAALLALAESDGRGVVAAEPEAA